MYTPGGVHGGIIKNMLIFKKEKIKYWRINLETWEILEN